MCSLLIPFSGSVLIEELLGGYKHVLAPFLCPSHVRRHSKVCRRSVSEGAVRARFPVLRECTGHVACLTRAEEGGKE